MTPTVPGPADPSAAEPSMPCNDVLVLPLDLFESRDYFQQMLGIDSALRALALSKDRLIKMTRPKKRELSPGQEEESEKRLSLLPGFMHDILRAEARRPRTPEGVDSIHESIASVDALIKTFEGLQETARHRHALQAGSLGQNNSGIMGLPNEILSMIFNKLRPLVNTRQFKPTLGFAEDEHDTSTIEAIGLTCRRFQQLSSHLLVRRFRVSPNVLSLRRVEQVLADPGMWRAERVLTIDLRCYSRTLAWDFEAFKEAFVESMKGKVDRFNELLEELEAEKEEEEGTPSTQSTQRRLEPQRELKRCFRTPEEVASCWAGIDLETMEQGIKQAVDIIRCFDEIPDVDTGKQWALLKGHVRYGKLYQQQEEILRDGEFTRKIAAAVAAASKSKVWLSMSDGKHSHWDMSGYGGQGGFEKHGPYDLDLFADPDKLVEHVMLRPRQWLTDEGRVESKSLLYEIPLAIREAGGQLAGFTVELSTCHVGQDRRLTSDRLLAITEAIKDPAICCSLRLNLTSGSTFFGWFPRDPDRFLLWDRVETMDRLGLLFLLEKSLFIPGRKASDTEKN